MDGAGGGGANRDGETTFLGVDLAWGRRNPTGVCAVRGGRVRDSALLRTDEEIIRWLAGWTGGPCVVGIDAPLVVPNATGRRMCESVVTRWLGSRHAGAHSSNTGMPAFAGEPRGAHIARELGLSLDPAAPRCAIEVYPHAALVVLFDLPTTLGYKAKAGRTMAHRREQFGQLMVLVEALRHATPALRVAGPRWTALRGEVASPSSGAALDRAEDEIDAHICAYIAMHLRAHGDAGARVIGDPAGGAIVCPIVRADGSRHSVLHERLDAAVNVALRTDAGSGLDKTTPRG